jgi:hypothetical protein
MPKWQIPINIRQADASPLSVEWREARQRELDRLCQLDTWELIDPPSGANVIGSKWVFALKSKPDGTIDKFKARLVCQGFGQKEGVDFDETYANTAGKTTVRVFLALICVFGLKVKQMDVTTAFLYGEVDKDIYMRQPPGHDDGSGRVCKLLKALYGMKQAPRIWEQTLRATLYAIGFVASHVDPCLYVLRKDGQVLFLLDFVDDMLLASHSDSLIQWVSQQLCKEYDMTDMGDVQKYIGLHVLHDREKGEMWVHQAPAIVELAEKFGIQGESFPDTPLPSDFVLEFPWEQFGGEPPPDFKGGPDPLLDHLSHKRFRKIVGSLNYIAHSTRIDVAFAVNQLSRVSHAPRSRHLAAAERCIAYLRGNAHLGLHFTKSSGMFLECFVDANYCSSGSKRSMTGFLLKVGGAPVFWTARKQDKITTSTCDAESYAVMTAVQYVGFTRGLIAPLHVRTKDQPADYLTKRLDAPPFQRCCELSGLHHIPP